MGIAALLGEGGLFAGCVGLACAVVDFGDALRQLGAGFLFCVGRVVFVFAAALVGAGAWGGARVCAACCVCFMGFARARLLCGGFLGGGVGVDGVLFP